MRIAVKKHFKMYKAGKRWLFAAITVATVGVGTGFATQAVAADGNDPEPTVTQQEPANNQSTNQDSHAAIENGQSSNDVNGSQQQGTTNPEPTTQQGQTSGATAQEPATQPGQASTPTSAPTTAPVAQSPVAPEPVPQPAPADTVKQPAIVGTNPAGNQQKAPTDDYTANEVTGSNGVTIGTWLSATGTDGTQSATQSTDGTGLTKTGKSALDPNATNIAVNYLIANNTDHEIPQAYVLFRLPKFYGGTDSASLQLVNSGTAQDLVDQLNAAGIESGFATSQFGSANLGPNQIVDPNFDLTSVDYILALWNHAPAGHQVVISIPQTILDKDSAPHNMVKTDQFGIENYVGGTGNMSGSVVGSVFLSDITSPVTDNQTDVTASIGDDAGRAATHLSNDGDDANDLLNNYTVTDPNNLSGLSADFSLTNRGDQYTNVDTYFVFPRQPNKDSILAVDPSKTSQATFTANLPSTANIQYSVDNGKYMSYADLMKTPNFSWDKLVAIHIGGQLGTQGYNISVPLMRVGNNEDDLYTKNATGSVFALNYTMDPNDDGIQLHAKTRLAEPTPFAPKDYLATVNEGNNTYQALPDSVQKLLQGKVNLSDIEVDNTGAGFQSGVTAANTIVMSGAQLRIPTSVIQKAVENAGYTVALQPDGQPQEYYTYTIQNSDTFKIIPADNPGSGTGSGTGNGGSSVVNLNDPDSFQYVEVVPVIDADDSNLVVNQNSSYKADDNLKQIVPSTYYDAATVANNVTTTVNDPDGILTAPDADGVYHFTKPGEFQVTYTAVITPSVTVKKTVKVTVLPELTYTSGVATSTRTITFVNDDGTKSLDPVVQTITYKTVTNGLTGETVYTPQGAYYLYTPIEAGYTANPLTVAQLAVGATNTMPGNINVVVHFTRNSTGGGTNFPGNPNQGGGTTTPSNPGNGGNTTTPVKPGDGNTTTPTSPNTNGGATGSNNHGTLPDTFGGQDGSNGRSTTSTMGHGNAAQHSTAVATAGTTPLLASGSSQRDQILVAKAGTKQPELPQTGDASGERLGVMGMALAAVLAAFGIGYKKRDN